MLYRGEISNVNNYFLSNYTTDDRRNDRSNDRGRLLRIFIQFGGVVCRFGFSGGAGVQLGYLLLRRRVVGSGEG